MEQYTRAQIKESLARLYRREYDSMFAVLEEGKAAAHEGDKKAFKVLKRLGDNKSMKLDGIKAAAATLGIGFDEFLEAVNADRRDNSHVGKVVNQDDEY